MLAMQKTGVRKEITEKLGKTRLDQNDLETLLDLVFQSEPVVELKKRMGSLCLSAQSLAKRIRNRKGRSLLTRLAKSMLEDL